MKSFIQHLHEVGNRPYSWKRTGSRDSRTQWRATFNTPQKSKYVFQADVYDQHWQVVFHLFGAHDSMGLTGTEGTSAIRVLGTVAQIFEAFVKDVNPDKIEFAADKSEGSGTEARSKIYSRFAKMFARKHGYKLKEKDVDNEKVFGFTRQQQQQQQQRK